MIKNDQRCLLNIDRQTTNIVDSLQTISEIAARIKNIIYLDRIKSDNGIKIEEDANKRT